MMQLCRPLAQIKIKKVFFLTVGLCNMLDSWLGIFFPRHFNTRIHKGVLKQPLSPPPLFFACRAFVKYFMFDFCSFFLFFFFFIGSTD